MENSKIEWCDHTFNPWIGCTKVSPGCANCYAETLMDHRYGRAKWGKGEKRVLTSETYWKQPLRWNKAAIQKEIEYKERNALCDEPMEHYHRPRVFCASLADVFDEEVPNTYRHYLFSLIDKCPNLDWLILTKRARKMSDYIKGERLRDNVWLGVSAENQAQFDSRVSILCGETRAWCRFVSMEPLLSPVDIYKHIHRDWNEGRAPLLDRKYIDWIIVGGESGPRARPVNEEWIRDIRDQCKSTKTAFFMKQLDKKLPIPADLNIRQFP
jgi:protein gp37